jgi:hypothetical protein
MYPCSLYPWTWQLEGMGTRARDRVAILWRLEQERSETDQHGACTKTSWGCWLDCDNGPNHHPSTFPGFCHMTVQKDTRGTQFHALDTESGQ